MTLRECIVYQNSQNFPVAAPNGHRHLSNSKSFLALISADRAHKTLQLRTRFLANKIVEDFGIHFAEFEIEQIDKSCVCV